jgi:hypothetical protein
MSVSETVRKLIDYILSIFKSKKTRLLYFIDPNATPLSKIDFKALRKQGFTDVAVPIWTVSPEKLVNEVKPLTDAAGITLYGWCWDGTSLDKIRYLVDNKINVLLDEETYQMTSKVSYLASIYNLTKGKVKFTICVKPDGWDGGQAYTTIAKYCDYIMPMLYLGDYLKGLTDLNSFVKNWNSKLPGKLWACLETYESDKKLTPKTHVVLLNEIEAVIAYVQGVALFRYGLSKFEGLPDTTPTPTPSPQTGSVLVSDVLAAAKVVAEYIQVNQKTPSTVTVGGQSVGISTFNRMMAATVLVINSKKDLKISNVTVSNAASPLGGLRDGELQKKDYIDAANRLNNWIWEHKKMPNYITTPIGDMSPSNFTDMYSRALKFYDDTKALPNFIYTRSVGTPSTPVTIPSELKPYLQATSNCQVNDASIQEKAKQLKTATNIFNFVLGKIYSYYYNTRLGAKGALTATAANCCDMTHLLIALSRAAGIPARYVHGSCVFGDGKRYGHVWAELYADGKWVWADPINDNNRIGKITNWNTKTVVIHNRYQTLPF